MRGILVHFTNLGKLLYHSVLALRENEIPVRAAALTYTTMLAGVPFLILVSIVAAKAGYLPLLSSVLPELQETFGLEVPLERLEEIIEQAQSVRLGRLGIVGSVSLLAISLLAISSLEQTVNVIWGIQRHRNWLLRMRDFVPFLFFLVLFFLLISWMLVELRAYLHALALAAPEHKRNLDAPYRTIVISVTAFSWFAIGFIFYLIPHTKVRVASAFAGATLSTVVLFAFVHLTLKFQTFLFARYSAVYGSLAVFPVLMILLYFGWMILLYGVIFAQGHQKLVARRP
ncbi:MAG: YihY/virulence factor BrkB family protein [Candidatus Eiseniibacteriota bacterium]|nr:MAG: YihY/virulence factor BrkB family protein [Candidatus Eisenbacteria bacterium]